MRFLGMLVALVAVVVGSGFAVVNNDVAKKEDPKSIEDIMKEGMKGGLSKKVASGEATDEEKLQMLSLLVDLVENDAPKGDEMEWKMMAGTAMMNAAKVVLGRDGAEESFKASIDCKACHDKFK
ncbi:MAG: hypothetical protein R3C03_05035 [Pirellulaceae bacterium]